MDNQSAQQATEPIEEQLAHLRLDDISIETKGNLLPEDLRERFVWLAVFAREECHRDIDTLGERFRAVGVYRDKTTWIRLLKGQWNRMPNGTVRQTPLVSKDKLIEEIDALRNGVRVEAMRGKVPFVVTSVAQSIFSYLDLKRAPDRVNKFGVIIGPTGSQKTASLKEYCRRNNHGACLWLEAPENGSMTEFIARLAEAYGGPEREPYDRKRRRIFASFNERKCIVVDNCQRLYRETRGSDQPLFGFLQRLQDERGGAIILTITPTFERTLTAGMLAGFFEQFEGRAGGRKNFLRLPDFAPPEDVVAIAKAFGLRDAGRHEKLLVEISREPGRIRRLFEDLQSAKLLAEAEKKELTIAHLHAAREE